MKESPPQPNDPDSDLISMIAHDLRSPITVIKGFSQLALRRSDLAPQVRDCLTATLSEADRISALIDDLVLLSQLRHRWNLQIRQTTVSTIVRSAIQRLRLPDPSPTIVVDEGAEVKAWCDPVITERALVLLLSAALRYCAGSDRVSIGVHRGDDVIIEVVPSGVVRQDKLPLLRRAVGQTDTAPVDEFSPIGLSMYICRRLIEKQEGRVWIDHQTEARTRFMIALPGHST